jgi:hypothetical protein
MQVITPGLFSVIRRFPEHKHTVRRLFQSNEIFRTLCDDYGRCAEALEYWNQFSSEETAGYRQDYTELVREIESEIDKLIENGGT